MFRNQGVLYEKYLAISAFAAAAIASPAQSAHIVRTSDGAGNMENVLLDIDRDTADNIARGTLNQSGRIIVFTLPSNETLVSTPQGQAEIDSADGEFNSLTFNAEDGFAFSTVSFNIDATVDGFLDIAFTTTGGSTSAPGVFTLQDFALSGAGENRFTFTTNDGSLISSVTLLADRTLFSSVSQFRLGSAQVAPVPEPATWAMMLFGFGAVGYSMRRRKVGYRTLQAV